MLGYFDVRGQQGMDFFTEGSIIMNYGVLLYQIPQENNQQC